MNLADETKQFIDKSVRRFYYKAIESGASVSTVESIGMHLYKISVGKLELTYMGTVDGKANVVGASGDVF